MQTLSGTELADTQNSPKLQDESGQKQSTSVEIDWAGWISPAVSGGWWETKWWCRISLSHVCLNKGIISWETWFFMISWNITRLICRYNVTFQMQNWTVHPEHLLKHQKWLVFNYKPFCVIAFDFYSTWYKCTPPPPHFTIWKSQ